MTVQILKFVDSPETQNCKYIENKTFLTQTKKSQNFKGNNMSKKEAFSGCNH